jgi:GNAT superfamily N-acetyltransferase
MNKIANKPGTGLKFVRVSDVRLIPARLVEQVQDRRWDAERFYALAPVIAASPYMVLGVFADAGFGVQGFLWATVDPLEKALHVNVLSVDKKYQGRGVLHEARGILEKLKKSVDADKITWTTTRPAAFARLGKGLGVRETGRTHMEM